MELEPEGISQPDSEAQAGRHPVVLAVEAMLDDGRLEEALDAALEALDQGDGNALDLTFLAGEACLALGRGADAERYFRAVLAMDPDCPASRSWLAKALFLQWRFDDADAAVQAALELSDAPPDAHALKGALLERRGLYEEAEACFRRANAMAPDLHPTPIRMSRQEFAREVRRAAAKLPRQFRQALDRVPVEVQDVPHESLAEGESAEDVLPDILGLFEGVPLPETDGLDLENWRPNRILLFQRNLERAAFDRDDLIEQIRITLWHELGHYLGFEEEDMDDMGLA
ncbi:MAG: metallopeptidase family protein [Planctomycetes bacterium]|nr:metallopeptidase family protein [Planctomycetota bacterium]